MQATGELKTIALAGIPNVGKTTIFNKLTGSNQKVANYPGVTVDKKMGKMRLSGGHDLRIIDLPGTLNLYPRSEDELVVFRVLSGLEKEGQPDGVVVVADMSNLERGLFLATQIMDLGLPAALVLNMEDSAKKMGISVNNILLSRLTGVPVVVTRANERTGVDSLKELLESNGLKKSRTMVSATDFAHPEMLQKVQELMHLKEPYEALQMLKFSGEKNRLDTRSEAALQEIAAEYKFDGIAAQREETRMRYQRIRELLEKCLKREGNAVDKVTRRLDSVFLNRVWGFVIFALILFVVFQAIFTWAEVPMNLIDKLFAFMSAKVAGTLPAGPFTDLLSEGIIPGIGGIVIFIPQIALLFGFLAILEGSGYMARAVFITDRLMRPFGLNGKSVVPLISGVACAVPAIMATRNIGNMKDRLITIMVTPLMSCSARLPVYIILIGITVPNKLEWGFLNLQGIALLGMYLLGTVAALLSALVMRGFLKNKTSGNLMIELPRYRWPSLRNVLMAMYQKARTFVLSAGKIILAISIILWVLASYGPGDEMSKAVQAIPKPNPTSQQDLSQYKKDVASARLESSYAGMLGHALEPVIKPLGYNWKIGIALVTSFAAREVFVSTMTTLYSIGDDPDQYQTIQQKLKNVVNPDTGKPFFSVAVGFSLLVFYAFAMQCMSTLAVVHRETKGWKWPIIQTIYMTSLAYISAFAVFHLLS